MLERDPRGGDRLDRLVVNRLAARPAVFQPEIDRHELESDRQRVGQPMDRPRQLRADSVAQELRHLVSGTHERHGLQSRWDASRAVLTLGRAGPVSAGGTRSEPLAGLDLSRATSLRAARRDCRLYGAVRKAVKPDADCHELGRTAWQHPTTGCILS